MGIPKIIFSPESHHPPHPCIFGEIRHHPSAQLVVLFVVVSSFSRVVAISPSTPCLLLDKFTAPEFRKVARELSDLFFPSPRPSSRPHSSLPPTGGPHLSGPSPSSRARLGLEPESSHATPRLAARRLGAHAKDSLGPYLSAALPPWAPSEPQPPPPPQTLAREPPLPSSELRVAPPFRRFPSMFSPPRRFASW